MRLRVLTEQQMIPLERTQLYAADGFPNRFWHFERNATAWAVSMAELTRASNALSNLMLHALAPSLPGARIGAPSTRFSIGR